ncbi:MAG: hypothetical protein GX282_05640 [Campylobacteraceae bacterium]|nr:hypothetical protein [Campylobacteraceae bacterium]
MKFSRVLAVLTLCVAFVFGAGLKVHSFTGASGSVSNILEFDEFLILVDPQETVKSERALNRFIETLNKPLEAVILATHPISSGVYEGVPTYGTRAMDEFVASGKVQFFIDLFGEIFKEDMIRESMRVTNFLEDGKNVINGVSFIIHSNDNAFPPEIDFEIEGQSIYFTHIAADNSHYFISSRDAIKEQIKKWENVKKKGHGTILSSHMTAVSSSGVEFVIEYLKTAQNLLNKNLGKEAFISEMKRAYPAAKQTQFLEMSANNLYK